MTAEQHLKAKTSDQYIFTDKVPDSKIRALRLSILEAMESYATDRLEAHKKSVKGLLVEYSEFLKNHSYMDDDWRSEVPNAIDRFLND